MTYPAQFPQPPAMQPPVAPAQPQPMTPTGQLGSFTPATPQAIEYDKFRADHNVNKALLVEFRSFMKDFTSTAYPNPKDTVTVDVFDLTTNSVYIGAMWGAAKLVDQVKHLCGDGTVYGVELYMTPTKNGREAVAVREIADPQWMNYARQVLAANPTVFSAERARREAEAAAQQAATAVAPQGYQLPNPVAAGYPAQPAQPQYAPPAPAPAAQQYAQPAAIAQPQYPQQMPPAAPMPAQYAPPAPAAQPGPLAQMMQQAAQNPAHDPQQQQAAAYGQPVPQYQQPAAPSGPPQFGAPMPQQMTAEAVEAAIAQLSAGQPVQMPPQ